MYKRQDSYDIWDTFDYIVPVPLHKKRLKERGYNQSEMCIRDRRKCGRKPLLLIADIHKTVQFLFLQYQWSPEQISFRLKHEKNPIPVSYTHLDVYKRQAQD